EERADVHFQYPVLTTAPNGTLTQSIVGRSSGPIPIRVRIENRIDHSLHISFHCALGHPIRDRWDAKDALLAVVFRNALFPYWWREIRPRAQPIPDAVEVMIALPIKVRERLTITARRATIAAYILIRHPHQRLRYLECF